MSDAVTAAAAAPATKWWLEPGYREQYADIGVEHGQMAPKTWENRPDEAERFKKFLSGLNPLHHIPGVSLVYREITGEEIEPGQRILGGALFGGVFGLVSGAVNALVQYATGKDIGGNAMAMLKGDGEKPVAELADVEPAAAKAAAPQTVVADASAPLDLDALEAELTGEAPPAPLPKPPLAVAPAPVAAADVRWFPARGRDNGRGTLTPSGPALTPAMLAQTQPRQPSASALPIAPRAGAGAYDQALELSRELQRHYSGMGVRPPTN